LVTFDTNTLSGVIDPDRQFGAADDMPYQAVHGAVKTRQIRGFFSERPAAYGVSLVPLSFCKAVDLRRLRVAGRPAHSP
jgi:hypothetical protein